MIDFDARSLFRSLTDCNILARSHGFRFVEVSDIDGFADAIDTSDDNAPLVALSDTSAGAVSISGAPRTRRVKTVFLFMPHDIIEEDHIAQRARAFAVMRELARQFLSVLIREATMLAQHGVTFIPQVAFEELDTYFHTGGACAYFQFAADFPTDLTLNPDQWTQDPITHRLKPVDGTQRLST